MALEVTLSNMTDNASDTLPEIILTRPQKAAQEFSNQIRAVLPMARIILSPLLQIKFIKPTFDLNTFVGVIFTSANGVEAMVNCEIPKNMPCFAVGSKTAEKAENLGFVVTQSSGNADDLIALILSRPSFGRLLHISGEHTRGNIASRLEQAGKRCAHAIAYQQEALSLNPQALASFKRGKPVILPLFSPRTAQLLMAQDVPLEHSHMIALSEAVAEPFKDIKLSSLTVAEAPNSDAVLNNLISVFQFISSLEAPNGDT